MCGLVNLGWEARQERATQILASPEWKQQLCNDLIGLSFRELEITLQAVASERQRKEDSYERKLEAFKDGKTTREPKKPMRRDSSRSNPNGGDRSPTPKPKLPPRSLQEILAQVYAPRVVQELSEEERVELLSFRPVQPTDEIPSDSSDGDN